MKKNTWYLILISFLLIGIAFAAQTGWNNGDSGLTVRTALQANDTELYGIAATTVVGPAVALDNEILVSDGTTGKLVKKSGAIIDANGLALPAVPIPIDNYISSDNNDADQTSATTRCVVTTGTAASVVSDYYIAVKDGGDASGVETDVIHVDGSGSLINMLWPTVLQAGDIELAELATDSVDYTKTTGSFKSLTPVTDDADNFAANFTGANLYGGTFIANATGTAVLPAIGTGGMNFTIITLGAIAVIADPNASDSMLTDGVQGLDGENITNLSTAGDIAVFQYYSASGWVVTTNGWTAE